MGSLKVVTPPGTGTITVTFGDRKQTMDGFGASDPFLDTTTLTTPQADQFFGTSAGQIGLSLLFVGIDWTGDTMGNWDTATKAVVRGAKLVAAPWTAAAAQKDNASLTNGGHLLTASRDAWATTLAAFQALCVSNAGAPLYAISVQNEPDFSASYNSMLYTTAEMTAFVKVLGPKLAALTPRPKLILPETSNWDSSQAYATAVLADGTAAPYLDIGGAHQYAGTPATVAAGKPTWMTEMSYFTAFDATMTQALVMAADIHAALTTGNASAWIWWWILRTAQTDNQGLTDTTQTTKRLWALGNWSKFVRPGYVRIGTSGSLSNVSITAFEKPSTGEFVVVAINAGSTTSGTIALSGLAVTTVTPWLTSASADLAQQADVSVSKGVFTASLVGNSVTSFVGTGS